VKRLLLSLLIAASPVAAISHESAKGPNGGPVADNAGHHVEMVANGTELVLFLTGDADKPIASAGTKNARAVVQDGGKTVTVALQPAAPNMLVGKAEAPIGAKARVVFSASVPGHALTARYVTE